ncbi:hypothetical protein EUTSA_v10010905mg [Eutrema salsugineum]|uniref:F-box domain-containing protein n=1 Tax=Eutrema salsugineum TaxID=72664 RepID=V4LY91_EUTSA|nr:probable F-box protein At3g56670 [Eutrema salsugineum]ESQ44863.1 hypothetical protein EUTSA_v10010905mg [Eutrema salsugineum]
MEIGHEAKKQKTSPWPTRLGHGGDIDIPLDLKVEILKKLPAKSLKRFRSVSKQWSSITSSRRDFIESIVTRSLTRPPRDGHIISHFPSDKCFLALSSNTCHTVKELLLVPKKYHQSVRGLICCWSANKDTYYVVAIYNPTTRQSFYLPKVTAHYVMGVCLFGYDPIEYQYKLVFLPENTRQESCKVFTLGDAKWRTIQSSIGLGSYSKFRGVVCIKGTVYFQQEIDNRMHELIRFDVRSERFHHVDAPTTLTVTEHNSTLVNYQGKLGFICCEKGVEIWVMEKQGWSKIFFCEMEGFQEWRVTGVTRGSEIVFTKLNGYFFHHRLCVYYYDPKRNSMRCVDLEDYYTEEGSRNYYMYKCRTSVLTLLDHVENTMCLK